MEESLSAWNELIAVLADTSRILSSHIYWAPDSRTLRILAIISIRNSVRLELALPSSLTRSLVCFRKTKKRTAYTASMIANKTSAIGLMIDRPIKSTKVAGNSKRVEAKGPVKASRIPWNICKRADCAPTEARSENDGGKAKTCCKTAVPNRYSILPEIKERICARWRTK